MQNEAKAYEESLDRSLRRAEGIFYTPADIVEQIFSDAIAPDLDLSDKIFCDPCCGSGNFLLQALKVGFRPENIFGFDSDRRGVEIARKRIDEYFKGPNSTFKGDFSTFNSQKQIFKGDFFKLAAGRKLRHSFDFIMTNPPWGSKIARAKQLEYSTLYGSGRSVDSSALVLCAALRCLKADGTLALLLPDSFFNIGSFEDVRRRALGLRISHLRDFGKPFAKLMTRAQSIVLRNSPIESEKEALECTVACFFEGREYSRTLASFAKNPKSIINLWLDSEGADIVEKIFQKEHITLQGRARWGLGIVTGDNAKHCSDTQSAGQVPILRGTNLLPNNTITEATSFIDQQLTGCQQVAPREIYTAPSKIIYRFISNDLIFCHDTLGRFTLNSVNILIPDSDLPIAHRELAALLSSPLMNWLFRAVWRTHKVLRNDIERLPLHAKYFEQNAMFDNNKYCEYLSITPPKI